MSNFIKTFQPRFVDAVRKGTKTQTIRKTPKRMPRPEDTLSLRTWTGKPYRSKQEILGDAVVTEVHQIQIIEEPIMTNGIQDGVKLAVTVDGNRLGNEIEQLSIADGFSDPFDMWKVFKEMHGLPFEGILIRWRLV